MNPARASVLLCLLAACAEGHYATVEPGHPAFVVPHHIAEGKGEGTDPPLRATSASPGSSGPPAAPASAPHLSARAPLSGSAPDPEPLLMAEQWQYQLLYQNGMPSVESAHQQILPRPMPTPRRMGRFALELWIGHELIDRVRFDFPLIAAEEQPGVTRRPLHDAPSLAPHAIARIRVSLPASPRATRLVLVDRATEKSQELPWPPDRPSLPSPVPLAPSVNVPMPVPLPEKTHSGT